MIDLKLLGGAELVKEVKRQSKAIVKATKTTVHKSAIKVQNEYKRRVRANKNIDTATLMKGIKSNTEDGWTSAEIGATASYAPYVEFGSNPHHVPISALWNWTARKLLGVRGSGMRSKKNRSKIFIAARGVQQKIARSGTPEYPALRPAIEMVEKKITKNLIKEIGKAIK